MTLRDRIDRFGRTGDPAAVDGLDALREAAEQRAAKLWDDSRQLVHLSADEEPALLR